MPSYSIKTGFNQSLVNLVPFILQPRMTRGIEYAEIVYGGDLSSSQIGTPAFDLVWSNTITRENMNLLLAQAGLSAKYGSEVDWAQVTVLVKDNEGEESWIRLNAVAQRPRDYKRHYIGWADHVITFQVIGFAS